ncbi:transposase [Endozoicomonas sp. SCSIO W0465]|uniref:transposase n=1 Tax=Endozoicomonas sp. SCSIO W0465 TaxID=2918516 RepID=UPI002075A582|nr:transposase [Endozoicomonas sp. SCSIO W0465]USE36350.1 transposase [Endozoicomonas sp. SCSIO W0465]
MSRPLRIQYAGALYHVTSRGNERKAIYREEVDFNLFLDVLAEVCDRFNWVIHSWCLMTNHYHLVVETPDGNLSAGMRQLNGVYTTRFNRRYGRVGHLFQGRYKAILVDKSAYLLELSRYVVLNPVRARMVDHPGDWLWSSYRYTLGELHSPDWLATDAMLLQFSDNRERACERFVAFVLAGVGVNLWVHLKQQIYLGDDQFVSHQQQYIDRPAKDKTLTEVPHKQRRKPGRSLEFYQASCESTKAAVCSAFASGSYTQKAIADFFGLHYSTVSKMVARQT